MNRPSFPKPFGFRTASAMTDLSVPSLPVCPYRLPRVGYWQFPDVSVCPPIIDTKKDLPSDACKASFLEHSSTHSGSIHVFTDGSKSDVGVGYSVIFPSFCRGGSLPSVASVFTAELSAIVLALKIIFTLPVSSFTIFSDSRRALSALGSFNISLHPLILSALE